MMEEVKPDPRLRPLWDAILEVYKVFAAICDKHGLRYCADTGTTLGAIRHKGFIPWDDDMDMQMPRPDYDKFVELVQKELPKGLAWVDRFNCQGFTLPFGKVVVTDREVIRKVSECARMELNDGIFVDVFPLDGYPDGLLAAKWRDVQDFLLNCRLRYFRGLRGCRRLRSIVAWLMGATLFAYNVRTDRDKSDFYERRARRYPFGKTRRCVSIGLAAAYDDKPYPFKFFGAPKTVSFENVTIPVQEDYDGYLKAMFGNYMELPPPETRHSTHDHHRLAPWLV